MNLLLFLGKAENVAFPILSNAFIKNELSKFWTLCANTDIKYLLFTLSFGNLYCKLHLLWANPNILPE